MWHVPCVRAEQDPPRYAHFMLCKYPPITQAAFLQHRPVAFPHSVRSPYTSNNHAWDQKREQTPVQRDFVPLRARC